MALPPPRRVGSAAAWTRPSPRNAIPVAAPISPTVVNVCPRAPRSPPNVLMNPDSANTLAVFRWDARGAAIAFVIREGYQGKPMPPGARPPKGPAANVSVKQKPAQK
jgi:hypothetical protein